MDLGWCLTVSHRHALDVSRVLFLTPLIIGTLPTCDLLEVGIRLENGDGKFHLLFDILNGYTVEMVLEMDQGWSAKLGIT